MYIYMSAIAGQTAEPNGLTFLKGTLHTQGVTVANQNSI